MNENVKSALEFYQALFIATDDLLKELVCEEKKIKVPEFVQMIAEKIIISAERFKELDFQIRSYIHNHPDYHISQGPGGGIMFKRVHQAKLTAKAKKAAAKEEIKTIVENRVNQGETK